MQLILAIDSDPRRSEQLANLVGARLQVDLVQATSAGEGLHALKDRIPDLILTSPLLSPFDDGVLDEYLRDLGAAATHVQTLRIPMLSTGPKKSAANRLFSLGRKKTPTSAAAPDGCDPKVFADEIAHYLTRSLEERSSSAKATEDRSAFARNDSANDAPSRVMEIEPEPMAQSVDDWGAPEALVREFREMAQAAGPTEVWTEVAPEPVYEETHVPGSILDLRVASPKPRGEGGTPIVHAPPPTVVEREAVFVEPEHYGFVEPQPPSIFEPKRHFEMARRRSAFIEPERPSYIEPERPVHAEPEALAYVKPEPLTYVEPEPLAYVEPEPLVYLEPEPVDPVQSGAIAYLKEQTRPIVEGPKAPLHITPPAVSAPVKPTAAPVSTAPTAPASGNSASFEAALAAIRAAWATPEPKVPASAGAGSSAGVTKPVTGSGEVDLTNQIDSMEDDSADDSQTPNGRRKIEKPKKRPENPRGRKTRGADGRDDWGVVDPNQYGMNNR